MNQSDIDLIVKRNTEIEKEKLNGVRHPAPFSKKLFPIFIDLIETYMEGAPTILDPFAGVGRIHWLREMMPDWELETIGNELEPEWARCSPYTRVGDSTKLKLALPVDMVITSPGYGNRMSDKHHAQDVCSQCKGTKQEWPGDGTVPGLYPPCKKCRGTGLSPRRSYTHDLGRQLSPNNSGGMQWGPLYRDLHVAVWQEVHRVLVNPTKERYGGIFVLNIKDHERDKQRVRVSDWHRRTIEMIGFRRLETRRVPLSGLRYGQNHKARTGFELVYVFEKI